MRKSNHKYIWGIVFVLILSIIITAGLYISNVKQMSPTENAEVIALVPEEVEPEGQPADNSGADTNSSATGDSETIQIEVPSGNAQARVQGGSVGTEQRQVGLLKAEMQVEDDVQIWATDTCVDIFDKYYKGTEAAGTANEVTVENAGNIDDMNLIAPGTESDYTFWVKNTGKVGIDYQVSFEEIHTKNYSIPIEVRVKHGETYILGNKNSWEKISALDTLEHEGHLSVKNYARYTLEWRWPFESSDAYDTYLGNEAVNKVLEQQIIIHTYGEGYDKPIYETFSVMGVKTGDAANVLLWMIIALLALVVVLYIRRKRDEKETDTRE